MDNYYQYTTYQTEDRTDAVMKKTFGYMFLALVISAISAYITASYMVVMGPLYYVFFALELILLWAGSSAVRKREIGTAKALFFLYSIVNGVTMSYIFLAYDLGTIYSVFLTAAIMFGITGLVGFSTKRNLSNLGRFCLMALIGVIVASIINIFFLRSTGFSWAISIIGLVIFIALTAYDMNKIKRLANCQGYAVEQIAIIGALELYLDFIGIFLRLLSLSGGRGSRRK